VIQGPRKKWRKVVIVTILALPFIVVPAIYLARPAAVLLAILAYKSKQNEREGPDAHECTGRWSIPVTGKDSRWTPMFPETNAAYFLLPVATRSLGKSVRFDVVGDFPQARFMSLALYDSDNGRLLSSLRDSAIKPYEGSENPFREKVTRDTPNRRFIVRVAPDKHYADYLPNILTYPKEVEYVTMILRVYRPDEIGPGTQHDVTGGVGLPRVHAYFTDSGTPVPGCQSVWPRPDLYVGVDVDKSQREIDVAVEKEQQASGGKEFPFHALRASVSGIFPNPHVTYGVTNLDRRLGEVVTIRFKAPTFFNNRAKVKFMDPSAEARYWSICLGGRRETNTIGCVADADVKLDDDGFANIAILPPGDKALADAAAARGMSVLSWGGRWITGGYRVLVRLIDNDAARVFSEDGATGSYMTKEQFLGAGAK
jgi:hypothetical protein